MSLWNKKLALKTLRLHTRQWINRASRVYHCHFPMPTVRCTLRGYNAGTADTHNWIVNYNLFLYLDNIRDFPKTIVPHEVAHLIVACFYGIDEIPPHGIKWKETMRELGIKRFSRTHHYNVDFC